ncbi:MAG: T9SS type A sorting domain-containing protein [Saprospiraceae bacterium]|nr:T9SS type A sorting domain-containing protein [Saprospiraceae bacterium]
MSQKILSIFIFLSMVFNCSGQLCPDCVYNIVFEETSQFWEDPDGIIYGADQIIAPTKDGIWTFFEVDLQLTRTDLFTRDVSCADGTIIRSNNLNSENSSLFPNPVRDKLIVESPYEDFIITIHTINGKQILSNAYRNFEEETILLNTTEFQPGIYILQILNKESQISHLFIVQ